MKCPWCDYPLSRVIDSRFRSSGIYRRRECLKCLRRFSTRELIEENGHKRHRYKKTRKK